jgi:multicomponent Na+:H+ antiporter subunit G
MNVIELRFAVALGFVVVGLALTLGGAVGLLRFPDLYTRLHAAAVADPLGSAMIGLGLLIAAPDAASAVRMGLLCLLLCALGPLWSHLLGAAAHAGGLAPLVGSYRAPRPGAREDASQ